MGDFDDRIKQLKKMRSEAFEELQGIANGMRFSKDGFDTTEQRRRMLQANLDNLNSLIAAYEDLDRT